MNYLNFHTHRAVAGGECTLLSAGLHPWHLTPAWEDDLQRVAATAAAEEACLIGECGLDRLCPVPYERQLAAFEAQIGLSERLQRPLVLHCVRALDDVLHLKRGTRQPWVFHGFRGKPQQMQQLLAHGFYLSFGLAHNADSLRACPADRLFLETDDRPGPVAALYATAAALRGTTSALLARQCRDNAAALRAFTP